MASPRTRGLIKSLHQPEYQALCDLLAEARRRAGLSQQAVADRLERPQSFVAKYEGSERRLDLIEFLTVAQAIEADPVRLLRHLIREVFGKEGWATTADRARLNTGVELGIDPETGRCIRVPVEGNLVTIASPRSGKTSGFVIPNLVPSEPNAWAGPAVVIDPKGDAYRAVRQRRAAMGRTVRCLDPLNHVDGRDGWNPLHRIDANDVPYLQGMALALLPHIAGRTDADVHIRRRAASLIVGALQCSVRDGRADPVRAAALLLEEPAFLKALETQIDPAALAAREILTARDEAGDAIIAAARQATQWLRDEHLQPLVRGHTFELSDLANGDVDLFIVLPADGRKHILAPYIRWLLADLFAAMRRTRPAERILAFVDEAHVLGRFDAILHGVGELPDHGISLWTVWQSRLQMMEIYGPHGAETLLGAAEITGIFDLSAGPPEELEYWSRTIGYLPEVKGARNRDPQSVEIGQRQRLAPRPLVSADELASLLKQWQVVCLTSGPFMHRPVKLRRSHAYTDPRFAALIEPAAARGGA